MPRSGRAAAAPGRGRRTDWNKRSWANIVDFIGALRYNVDYNNTNFLQGIIGENARGEEIRTPRPRPRPSVPPGGALRHWNS